MLSEWMRNHTRWLVTPVARFLSRTRISPNMLTLLGVLLNVAVGAVLATGRLRLGGFLVIIAGAFDALDGALARASGRTTRFGAFFDSVMDRFSEAAVFGGLLLHALQRGERTDVILIYAAIVGSLLVSYARARAEGIGVACKGGWFTRFERVTVLVIGLLLGQLRLALWVLAIFANLTALQRVYLVWRDTRGNEG